MTDNILPLEALKSLKRITRIPKNDDSSKNAVKEARKQIELLSSEEYLKKLETRGNKGFFKNIFDSIGEFDIRFTPGFMFSNGGRVGYLESLNLSRDRLEKLSFYALEPEKSPYKRG